MNEAPPLVRPRFFGKRRGFTLLELLVSAAIIGVLAALLAPVGTRILEEARDTGCASNMRQLHQLISSYAADYDGYLPPSIDQTPEEGRRSTWNQELQRVGLVPNSSKTPPEWQTTPVYVCPSMKKRDAESNMGSAVSYAMNNLLGPNSRNSQGKKVGVARFCEAASPSKTYLLFDGIYKSGGSEWSGIAYSSGNNVRMNPVHGNETRLKVLFLDGHIESRAPSTISWLATTDPDEAQTIAWRGAPQS